MLERGELDLMSPELAGTGRALVVAGQLDQLQRAYQLGSRIAICMSYWLWTHWPGWRSISPVAPTKKFGENVRRERINAGLTQEQLARRAGVHPSEVSRLEREARDPRLSTIVRLAAALGVEPAGLLDGVR